MESVELQPYFTSRALDGSREDKITAVNLEVGEKIKLPKNSYYFADRSYFLMDDYYTTLNGPGIHRVSQGLREGAVAAIIGVHPGLEADALEGYLRVLRLGHNGRYKNVRIMDNFLASITGMTPPGLFIDPKIHTIQPVPVFMLTI